MTLQEEIWFKKLTEEHRTDAKTFAKPNYRGGWDRLVDMYKESAHFVYELLQNADDARATEAHFELHNDKLIFKHNGLKKFSISNPDTEEDDRNNGKLGDLNSITSIAFSTKNDTDESGNSIGKFGIGFKSVYTYTESPEIYDKTMCFRIEQKIIPIRLNYYCDRWKDDETWFVIPFNNPKKSSEKAVAEILQQLSELHNPTLFLNNLEYISYEYNDENQLIKGRYLKKIKQTKDFSDDTKGMLLSLVHDVDGIISEDELWVFSRKQDGALSYSVGFGLQDGKLIPKADYAYCFFQTKEDTHLNFIIHAPFLLTPDRQHLKGGDDHNKLMISLLADLAADSIVYLRDIGANGEKLLIDDGILKVIPVKFEDFYKSMGYNYYSKQYDYAEKDFCPFYKRILEKFKSSKLLPAKNDYAYAKDAYRSAESQLSEIFTEKDLSEIKNESCHWVFDSLRTKQYLSGNDESKWIDRVIGEERSITEKTILECISSKFIEQKFNTNEIDWIKNFYEWLDKDKKRTELAKNKPFFIDEKGKACCAFVKNTLQLFLPIDGEKSDYHTMNLRLFDVESIREFYKKIGVKEPSFKDEIYSKILPRYASGMPDDEVIKSDFRKIIRFFKECPHAEHEEFVKKIKEKLLLRCKLMNGEESEGRSEEVYFCTDDLKIWFENKKSVKFIDIDYYRSICEYNDVNDFFNKIGVERMPRTEFESIKEKNSSDDKWSYDFKSLKEYLKKEDNKRTSPNNLVYGFYSIDGFNEFISNSIDEKKSQLLWKSLFALFQIALLQIMTNKNVEISFGFVRYWYNNERCKFLNNGEVFNPLLILLKKIPWLFSKSGKLESVSTIYVENLANFYDTQSIEGKRLIEILGIRSKPAFDRNLLDSDTQKDLDFVDSLRSMGIDPSDDRTIELLKKVLEEKNKPRQVAPAKTQKKKIVEEIEEKSEKIERVLKDDEGNDDSDEWTPPTYNSKRQIEKAKEKLAIELNRIEELEKAKELAVNATKYSYQWFKSMLQLEILRGNENNQDSREVHICFSKVERDPVSSKTLILSQPNKKIPSFIEELYGINLIIYFRGNLQDKSITFEAASIRSFSLRLKMMREDDVLNLDMDKVASAEIIAKSPVFLLQELQKQFDLLNYDNSKNLQETLCENIRFVFGPPGTGKTTFLAEQVILPWLGMHEACNILVLTPTNKAADVLTKRIMEKTDQYSDFLLRFGTTGDELIENSGVFCNRNFDISKRNRNIVVTTIARLPYDSFVKEGKESLFIREIEWDYIVVDEASMIPLVQMVYLLYSQKPTEFVIAGDPFQIEPTVAEESWKKENIYEMVGLKNFADPHTAPHPYKVERLEKQYRSIPSVGEIYSKLTYDGILQHNRTEFDRKALEIEGLDISALNIVKFPVSRYESIYRSKRLGQGSNYQIYSALFTYEFTCHLVNSIQKTYAGKKYSIGIISPYKAEADLIGNLLRAKKFTQDISVLSGTVHSFQGDEYDIMLTVFNTPENISNSEKMFLNHKNIINVAVSRARDNLFVLMPDEDTKGVDNLNLINQLENYMKESGICRQFHSKDLEKWMFGNENFLEENAFSTGHQSVNVYGEPEKKYEIRSEEDAIDIQVHLS